MKPMGGPPLFLLTIKIKIMSLDKYDSWKLASPDDDPNLVSPCCGEEYMTELEFRTEEAMYECSEW